MATLPTLENLSVAHKTVLMRVDFNVPLDDNQKIVDDSRIQAALPSIQYILDHGGAVVLMSHLGRPKGRDPKLSLKPCAECLEEKLKRSVRFLNIEDPLPALKPGDVVLLENLRFYEGEKKPQSDPSFVQKLVSFGDLYVNDAFGTAHRKHASTYEVVKEFPGKAAAGFLMEKEVEALKGILEKPKRPFYAIIGGAKISSKIGVLLALLDKVDGLLICGAMAHTFLKAKGIEVGDSLYEKECVTKAEEIMEKCSQQSVFLGLPIDEVIAERLEAQAERRIVDVADHIPSGWRGVDIGPKTIDLFEKKLKDAKTILWNGPAGVFEVPPFAKGTESLAKICASSSAVTVVGGGDSVAALRALHLTDQMSHISTGGGASLELIEKGKLPGIEILLEENKEIIANN